MSWPITKKRKDRPAGVHAACCATGRRNAWRARYSAPPHCARDPQPMLRTLQGQSGVRYLHRPANLEDLFIKLTGRELRD
jgi:hypothetical protein